MTFWDFCDDFGLILGLLVSIVIVMTIIVIIIIIIIITITIVVVITTPIIIIITTTTTTTPTITTLGASWKLLGSILGNFDLDNLKYKYICLKLYFTL